MGKCYFFIYRIGTAWGVELKRDKNEKLFYFSLKLYIKTVV